MAEYAAILFSMILVNNYVLVKFLGICRFSRVEKLDSAAAWLRGDRGHGACHRRHVALQQLLNALGLGYLQTIAFILVIAVLVQMLEIVIRYFLPALHEALGVYLPLITTNCAVLGRDHPRRESTTIRKRSWPRWAQAWASCWRWCCSAACAGAWTRPSRPRRQGMPSR